MNKLYCAQPLDKKSKKAFLLDYFKKCTPATFNDPECTHLQCLQRKSRSIGDLKMLLDGNFKTKTTNNNLIIILLDLIKLKGKDRIVSCLYCPDIKKLAFYSRTVRPTYWEYDINDLSPDTYRNTKNRGIDGYSWNDLIEIYKNKTK